MRGNQHWLNDAKTPRYEATKRPSAKQRNTQVISHIAIRPKLYATAHPPNCTHASPTAKSTYKNATHTIGYIPPPSTLAFALSSDDHRPTTIGHARVSNHPQIDNCPNIVLLLRSVNMISSNSFSQCCLVVSGVGVVHDESERVRIVERDTEIQRYRES